MTVHEATHAGTGTSRRGRMPRRGFAVVLAVVTVFAAVAAACAPPGPVSLRELKRTEFGNRALAESNLIGRGLAQPVLEFTVEDSPPSIFVNWVVPDAQAAAFESYIDLPPGFSLAKVRILESDPVPQYWMSLNVYRVSGITVGMRAEWSTYVDDGSGSPRFMIVRARAAEGSVDPLGPLALPEPFQHTLDGDGVIRTSMRRTEIQNSVPVLTPDNLFSSTIALPEAGDRDHVTPDLEWVAANDYIYWLNGVNDRTFHNSTAHSAELISVDLADVTLDDDSEWVPFVDPVPAHVLVYLGPIQFMIGPWWNVTEPDGRVDPATRASLLALKKTMYSGLTNLQALSVLQGTAEPIVQSTVETAPNAVQWHWRIPAGDLAAFTAAADLPAGLTPAAVELEDGDAEAAHWLSLRVQRVTGAESGLRAEWTTHVHDGTGIRTAVLEARADHRALDPVDRFTDPYPITHTVGATADTVVGSGPSAFSSSFPVPPAAPGNTVVPTRASVGANDLRYWSNGIADRTYSDTNVFAPKVSVDPGTVSITNGGPWAAFAGGAPERVWVDQVGGGVVVNPWWNLTSG